MPAVRAVIADITAEAYAVTAVLIAPSRLLTAPWMHATFTVFVVAPEFVLDGVCAVAVATIPTKSVVASDKYPNRFVIMTYLCL